MPQSSNQDALLKELQKFGISASSAKLYLALLAGGESSASNLSRLTGIHRVDVYKKLQVLVSLGLSNIKLGRPTLYQAADPSTALRSILISKQKDLDDLEQSKTSLLTELKKLKPLTSSDVGDKGPLYKLIVGRHHGYNEAARLLAQAKTDVDRVVSANGLKRNYNLKLINEYKSCADRGIKVRIISDLSQVPRHIVKFCVKNFELRHYSESSMRILIVDKKLLLFSAVYNDNDPSIESTSDRYLSIVDENIAKIISLMFEHLWKESSSPDRYL